MAKNHLTDEVREFLSENGKKGGATTRKLIQIAKDQLEEEGRSMKDVEEEVEAELSPRRRKAS